MSVRSMRLLSIVMVHPSHPPALARGVGADTPSWPLAFLEAIWVIKRHDQLSRRWGVSVAVKTRVELGEMNIARACGTCLMKLA